jgi:hypothetical protein
MPEQMPEAARMRQAAATFPSFSIFVVIGPSVMN